MLTNNLAEVFHLLEDKENVLYKEQETRGKN